MLKQDSKSSKESEVKYIKKVVPAANTGTQVPAEAKDKQISAIRERRPGGCIPVSGG